MPTGKPRTVGSGWARDASRRSSSSRPQSATEGREIRPLTPEELERIVVEIGPYGPLVTFAAETGLRPCEWLALERRDIDRTGRVLYVEREHVGGVTKPYGKTAASRRRVPLTTRAIDALEELPPRIDSPLIFPAVRGGYMNLRNWRGRDWNTAVEAAGLEAVPYVLRHTFASNALVAGVGTFELTRVMGTSLEMIERTYGHLVRGADDAFRSRLDAFAEGRHADAAPAADYAST